MSGSRSRTWLILLLILVLAAVAWWWFHRGAATERRAGVTREDPRLLLDRVWIDSKPERHTDYVQAMLMLSDAPIGAFQKASAYHAEIELFEHHRDGAQVKLHFPQSDRTGRFSYQVSRCDELPPFDLCLTLSDNPWKGPRRYYGLSESDAEARVLGDVRHQLLDQLHR